MSHDLPARRTKLDQDLLAPLGPVAEDEVRLFQVPKEVREVGLAEIQALADHGPGQRPAFAGQKLQDRWSESAAKETGHGGAIAAPRGFLQKLEESCPGSESRRLAVLQGLAGIPGKSPAHGESLVEKILAGALPEKSQGPIRKDGRGPLQSGGISLGGGALQERTKLLRRNVVRIGEDRGWKGQAHDNHPAISPPMILVFYLPCPLMESREKRRKEGSLRV